MPSSSTHYSYDIPTVGSDSTTYGTIINQFVNSLATKLKAVSDSINTAGVGASSTLAQVNRNIAQVDAINSRIPAGVSDLLPDPYSGATTPVSTWPYLNTELQAEGFSPPTTAQEVLDFDYSGFATYLNARFDSLSARIVGLDAARAIADSSTLVCETNKILDTIGEYKTVTTIQTVQTQNITTKAQVYASLGSGSPQTSSDFIRVRLGVYQDFWNTFRDILGSVPYTIRLINSSTDTSALDPGYYISGTKVDRVVSFDIPARPNSFPPDNIATFSGVTGSDAFDPDVNGNYQGGISLLQITSTTTTGSVSTQVKKTISDVDFSDCQ
jgi:hypothetical protein